MLEWSPNYSWLVLAAIAAALIVSVFWARKTAISPRLRSWLLFAPRIVVLCGLLAILMNPVRLHENQLPPRKPQVAYLVDCSRSMTLDRPRSRLDQVKEAIVQADAWVSDEERPRIHYYRFGETLSAAPSIPQLEPTADATRLREALEQLPSRFLGDTPKVLVIFSDGQVEKTGEFAALSAAYARLGTPIYVYPVGDKRVTGDVAIQELVVPRRARPGETVPIRATVRSIGFDDRRVVLKIRSEDADPKAKPLASLPITLSSEPQPFELAVEANRNLRRLVIETDVLPGEAIERNNRVPFQLSSGDRKLRVLYMEGTTGREYRWLHEAVTEDPDISCVSMVVNQQYASRPRLQRVDDPYKGFPATREELFKYDVVICSDISQGAFTREQLAWTVDLVGKRGGGFIMIGGHTSFGSGNWDQTSWDKLIPVDMSGGRQGRGFLTQQFHVEVPDDVQDHAIWQLLDDPAKNRQALAKMPKFYGTNLIQRLKPAATLLGQSTVPLGGSEKMAVFACETYGRGRTFAMSTDSTFHWGQDFERHWGEGDNRYYRKFWRNVVRWLSENSIAGSKRLVVDTDKIIYRPGEPIQLSATAYDTKFQETSDYQVTARFKLDDESPVAGGATLTVVDPQKKYAGKLTAESPSPSDAPFSTLQPMTVEVVATDQGRQIAKTSVEVQVLSDSRELLRPQPAPEKLTVLAEQSGGRTLTTPSELADLLKQFPSTPGEVLVHRAPVWDRGWFWCALLTLLAVEWSLRRRSGFG